VNLINRSSIYIGRLLCILGAYGIVMTAEANEKVSPLMRENVVIVLKHPDITQSAQVKIVNVQKSLSQIFKSSKYIFGYPIMGKVKIIDSKTTQIITSLLLNKKYYLTQIKQRCANRAIHGFRFTKGKVKVEFAIGVPCGQILIAYKINGKIMFWGAVIAHDIVKRLLALSRN